MVQAKLLNILLTLTSSGSNNSNSQVSTSENSSAPASASNPASGDPRAALMSGSAEPAAQAPGASTGASGTSGAASTAPPSANSSGVPAMPAMPAMPSAAGGFDPAAFAKQLQQLQQMQSAAGMNPMEVPKLPAHSEEGYHAGNIFIPAKDEGKMFIGGLNWETTDESMKNYFSAFGEVLEVNVMRDTNTGRSRGFGFLTFKDAKSVSEVLKREHFLDGKIIDPKRAIPREEQDKTAKIFVGGVGMDVTEDDFKNFFEQYGTVIDAQLMIDKDTGRPRGFGFVTFDDHAAVDKIVAEKFLDLKGKSIEVKRAEPRLSRDWQARNQGGFRPMQGGMPGMGAQMAPQQGYYPNAMDPNMMTQYYQQWQAYMAQMQGMMKGGAGGQAMPGMPNMGMPGMGAMPGMGSGSPAPASGPADSEPSDPRRAVSHDSDNGYEDRDPRRDRRRADDRRRSRSPPGNRRRRGGAFARDPRDRNFRR